MLGAMPLIHDRADKTTLHPFMEARPMRKLIIALTISLALIVSGISTTTFSSGELTSSVWANGGGD
jgi:hypothetical protein